MLDAIVCYQRNICFTNFSSEWVVSVSWPSLRVYPSYTTYSMLWAEIKRLELVAALVVCRHPCFQYSFSKPIVTLVCHFLDCRLEREITHFSANKLWECEGIVIVTLCKSGDCMWPLATSGENLWRRRCKRARLDFDTKSRTWVQGINLDTKSRTWF